MRLDVKGEVRFLDKNTGDGIAVSLGATCCNNVVSTFSKVLASLFDGKVALIDVDSDGDGTIDTYSGVQVQFIDVNGNVVAETPLDGTNGKVDFIDTGYSKVLQFKGGIVGSGTDEVYVSKVKIKVVGIDTSDMKTAVTFELGENDAPAKSPLAETTTNGKGIKVIPNNTKFDFVLDIELR